MIVVMTAPFTVRARRLFPARRLGRVCNGLVQNSWGETEKTHGWRAEAVADAPASAGIKNIK